MARRKPPAQHGARSEDGQAQSTAPPPLKRGPWTAEEDEVLVRFVAREGEGRWRTLPRRAGLLRCGKSCRLRWMNYLRPDIKRGPIAEDEEDLILRLHRVLGNRWSLIAGRLPGRTDNEIKNYWNSHLSKKLIAQGLDPRTHMPLAAAPGKTAAATHKTTAAPVVVPPQPPPPPGPVLPTSSAAGTGSDGHDNPGDGGNDDLAATMSVDADGFEGFGDQLLADYAASRGGFEDVMGCPMVDDDTFTSFLDSLMNERQLAADHKGVMNDQGGAI
ncbi:hypothetical protein CFC21_041848 [Triticum aestivum]|uniref:Uncharacterized protein n=2 Tax=Triticum aestivum TaxID=4565 RepID=A0A9R1JUN4_WHEAT|nr:transcription repressor MYB5-like [Triticum aestivum]KAF7030266.1 hypothetical protein CFC21_041848 [Triticum aestivum]CDM83829.1 unnamed protein product [Triticum aestivum]